MKDHRGHKLNECRECMSDYQRRRRESQRVLDSLGQPDPEPKGEKAFYDWTGYDWSGHDQLIELVGQDAELADKEYSKYVPKKALK